MRRSDWCRCQPLDITFGIFGRHMKVACSPARWQICLMALRSSTMVSAGVTPAVGPKVSSNWLGPNSISSERSGRPSAMSCERSSSISVSTRS